MEVKRSLNCKYCNDLVDCVTVDYMICNFCNKSVHLRCLRKGSVPGGLSGDVFFTFTCEDCSALKCEQFIRDKMPWLQALVLVLHHMQNRTRGLAKKGFFHWRTHLATFIDRHWEVLFSKDFKKKKKWMGTISGTLSHYSPLIFSSGTSLFNNQGWWTLTYPKLFPKVIIDINSELVLRKYILKETKMPPCPDPDLFLQIAVEQKLPLELLTKTSFGNDLLSKGDNVDLLEHKSYKDTTLKPERNSKRGNMLHSFDKPDEHIVPRKLFKLQTKENDESKSLEIVTSAQFLNPMCHYNTSLNVASQSRGVRLIVKLMGSIRSELILSPYSGLFLKPYIRRDDKSFPPWLKLMAEILLKGNSKNSIYVLPARGPIDYTYVQPSHIPAINSLCNQYFWPGIDLTECLQYPDFSCVVFYRKLIVGFAFLVPNVKINETYLSFIFTRPGWRNVGIGKFMMYHLIQTSLGKDITLHVSVTNPALLLYQKFGFKVENVVLDFYDKYLRKDTKESKNAFFCRLDR